MYESKSAYLVEALNKVVSDAVVDWAMDEELSASILHMADAANRNGMPTADFARIVTGLAKLNGVV